MAVDIPAILADLRDETQVTVSLLRVLTPADWDRPTPAAGWTIRDQVTHLAYFDDAATTSILDPERFQADAADVIAIGADFPDQIAAAYRGLSGARALSWFLANRAAMLRGYANADPAVRLPWYGPPMSVASSITARLMETWAHTQDIADALAITRQPTDRLRHIAHLGVSTIAFTHLIRGLPVPAEPIRVELTGPSGDSWTWGLAGAANRVAGPALDFCLVVTQRRNVADTDLAVTGGVAQAWIAIAQAFAGAPTVGPAPGTRITSAPDPGLTRTGPSA